MPDVVTMDKIVSLARRRGFVFPSSEIYGGLGSAYDYGHYGVLLKENVKAVGSRRWCGNATTSSPSTRRSSSTRAVWEASGHVTGFTDPLVDCRTCKLRFRADHLADPEHEEVRCGRKPSKRPGETPDCDLTEPRQFNLMFSTRIGAVEETGRTRTCGPRPRRASSSTSRTSPRSRAASRRSGSHRSGRRSATRSRPGTSSSARSSSSRWRWSTSCRLTRRRSGSATGSTSGSHGIYDSGSARATFAFAHTTPRSFRTTRPLRATSSTSSRSVGRSSRGSRTEATSTSAHTPRRPGRSSSGWTARSGTRRTSSSRRSE